MKLEIFLGKHPDKDEYSLRLSRPKMGMKCNTILTGEELRQLERKIRKESTLLSDKEDA